MPVVSKSGVVNSTAIHKNMHPESTIVWTQTELWLNSSTTQGIQHIWTLISQQLHVIAKRNVASVGAMLFCDARFVVRTSLCGGGSFSHPESVWFRILVDLRTQTTDIYSSPGSPEPPLYSFHSCYGTMLRFTGTCRISNPRTLRLK